MNSKLFEKFGALPRSIRVFNKQVGREEPTFVIAEIGNNHNGEMDLARRLVQASSFAGADAVKFQRRTLSDVFTKETLEKPQTSSRALGKTYGEYRQKLELTDDQFHELKTLAHSLGMAFFVTPFDIKSADSLDKVGMDAFKIASFDVTHTPLLEHVAKKGKPVFLSTGMASQDEIDEAVEAILKHNKNLIIKHCVSVYPTPDDELNLGAIKTLLDRYDPLPIGYSGHEIGYVPTVVAVSLGARAVERHITLDKSLPGPDHATVSLDVLEFTDMLKQIRRVEKSIADTGLYLHEKEIPHRQKHGKSVVAKVPILAGTVITAGMLCCKSPGHGIKPSLLHTVIGRTTKTDVASDTVLLQEHFV